MVRRERLHTGILAGGLLAALCATGAGSIAWAQDGSTPPGYHVGEDGSTAPADQPTDTSSAADTASSTNAGPVRLARFSFVQGNVTWRPSPSVDWSQATVNLPIRQGAQIWVTGGSRAEIQFDDGSIIRLGTGAVVTLQTLYSDANGEFTELRLNQGLMSLNLLHSVSIFQVDAQNVSAKAAGPARFRMGVDNDTEVAVHQGAVSLDGAQGQMKLAAGDYVDVADSTSSFQVTGLPPADVWDRFNDQRDALMNNPARYAEYCPPSVALCAGDLDNYGTWRDDPEYGHVWCPSGVEADWRPYYHGHWVWVAPFGWTWVSSEAWGWAPYHYGTWVHASYGWGWCPGPAVQYWSPAVVHFCSYNGAVAWVPLAPVEVHYPATIAIGFHNRNWSLFFSIGGAACYYPGEGGGGHYFAPHPWNNVTINHVTNITNIYNNNNYNKTINVNNVNISRTNIIPYNSRMPNAVTSVNQAGFGQGGRYTAVPQGAGATFFSRGRAVVAEGRPGESPIAGPVTVHPTMASFTPTHTFQPSVAPSRAVLSRPVYRASVPPTIAHDSSHSGTFVGGTPGGGPRGISPDFNRPGTGNPGNPGNQNRGVGPTGIGPRENQLGQDSPAAAAARARASLGGGGGNGGFRGGANGGANGGFHGVDNGAPRGVDNGGFRGGSTGPRDPGSFGGGSRRQAPNYHIDDTHSYHPSFHSSGGNSGGNAGGGRSPSPSRSGGGDHGGGGGGGGSHSDHH